MFLGKGLRDVGSTDWQLMSVQVSGLSTLHPNPKHLLLCLQPKLGDLHRAALNPQAPNPKLLQPKPSNPHPPKPSTTWHGI